MMTSRTVDDYSGYFTDRIIDEEEILFSRKILHRKSLVLFPDGYDFQRGTAAISGLLYALKSKSTSQWEELPIVLFSPVKKHLPQLLRGMQQHLTLSKKDITFLENARREQRGFPGGTSGQLPGITVGSTEDLIAWIDSFNKVFKRLPAPWFHLVAVIPERITGRASSELIKVISTVDSRRKIKPGFTICTFQSTKTTTLEPLTSTLRMKEVLEYPGGTGSNTGDRDNPLTVEKQDMPLLTKKEVMLPDVYRQMAAITFTTATKLKATLNSTGLQLDNRNWFNIGSITRLLADMRKKPANYTPEQRMYTGHLLRLVHIHEKIKTTPASDVLGMFSTLREPRSRGTNFIQLPGMVKLEELLISQSGEIHPLTASVLRECVDNVNNRLKTAVIAKNPAILDSLAALCKNAGIAVVSLAGSYHPKKGGNEGYRELSTRACKLAASEFYQGSAMIIFLPYNRMQFIEIADGVDAVIFHDYSRSGKEVRKLQERIKQSGNTSITTIKLFFVKNTAMEDSFWNLRKKNGKKQSSSKISSKKNLQVNNRKVEKKEETQRCSEGRKKRGNSTLEMPTGWHYSKLSRYLGKLDLIVSFSDNDFFILIHGGTMVMITVVDMADFMDPGFTTEMTRKFKDYHDPAEKKNLPVKQEKWLIVNRNQQVDESVINNTARFYKLYLELRDKPLAGFNIVSVLDSTEVQEFIITILSKLIKIKRLFSK